jgi:MoaA/NifB/PqqE/SkfB family radical SAM enzyme
MRGMGHLKRLKQRVITNTVITELNYKDLPQIAHLLAGLGVSQMHFSFIHICGTAQKNRHWIVPKKSNAMPFIKEALAIARAARIPAYTEAIPFCLMDGYEECISENIMPDTMIVDAEGVTQNYTEFRLHEGKAKAPKCKTCIRYKQCEGPWREYIELYGWREFKPIKRSTKK